MASTRTLQIRGLVTNGVTVNGMASLSFTPEYGDIVVNADADGLVGSEAVDRTAMRMGVSLTIADITQVAAILDGALGDTTFSVLQSGVTGATNWYDYAITEATDGAIVWNGMSINISKNADATATITGEVLFVSGSAVLADILAITIDQAEPTITYAARYFRPHNFSFNDGAAETLTHVNALSMACSAPILSDYGDDDVAMSSVDRLAFGPLSVTVDHGSTEVTDSKHINADLIAMGVGVLTIDLIGRAGISDVVLTINNLLWTGAPQNESQQYTTYQIIGQCGWRDATPTSYAIVDVPADPGPEATGLWKIE